MKNRRTPHALAGAAAIYCIASLAHFSHNAEFLADYPNLPAWLTRIDVYAAWLAITALGGIGLTLVRSRFAVAGWIAVAVYAALGFDGLGHYALAPMSAHTPAMNLTIWCEVAAAAVLLCVALRGVFDAGRRFAVRPMP